MGLGGYVIGSLAFVGVVSACFVLQPPNPGGPATEPVDWTAKAKIALLSQLRDPGSAMIDITTLKITDRIGFTAMACGYVNSRNGFGGFGGWRPFMVDMTRGRDFPEVDERMDDGPVSKYVSEQCNKLQTGQL